MAAHPPNAADRKPPDALTLRPFQSRRRIPAWALSVGFHAFALVILALVVHQRAIEPTPEPPRAAGIVLASAAEDVAYFQSPETVASQAPEPAAAASASGSGDAKSELPAAESVSGMTNSPELPGQSSAIGDGLLQDVVASGGGTGTILPALGDGDILANDPILNAKPRAALGPTATLKIFGTTSVGRSFVMLIDRSKSMGGEGLGAIEAAQHELSRAMAALSPQQKFQIVAYNQRLAAQSEKPIPATAANLQLAEKFMQGIVAHGQTEHRMALLAALRNKPEVIYVFTDAGDPVLTQPDLQLITLRADRKTVIHCVQFGYGPLQEEDPFLRKLARLNGGSFAYVDVSQAR